METTVKERIKVFISHKGFSINAFEKKCGLSTGYIGNMRKSLSPEKLMSIIQNFPDLNRDWLLYGEGEMLAGNDSAPQDAPPRGAVPFYGTLPVSAGSADLMSVMSDETPTGWLQLPEVTGALGAFPVVGCSMEPDIRAGDYVVITAVDRWERLDPDKIYLVITHDDRMIKHLETDRDDPGILWCTSPNYRSFAIRKDEIRAIYRVIFHGRHV